MTPDEIVEDILDADLSGRAGAFADILVALSDAIPDRTPDSLENYSECEMGRMVFEAGQAADEAWEWLRGRLRELAKQIRSSAELHI